MRTYRTGDEQEAVKSSGASDSHRNHSLHGHGRGSPSPVTTPEPRTEFEGYANLTDHIEEGCSMRHRSGGMWRALDIFHSDTTIMTWYVSLDQGEQAHSACPAEDSFARRPSNRRSGAACHDIGFEQSHRDPAHYRTAFAPRMISRAIRSPERLTSAVPPTSRRRSSRHQLNCYMVGSMQVSKATSRTWFCKKIYVREDRTTLPGRSIATVTIPPSIVGKRFTDPHQNTLIELPGLRVCDSITLSLVLPPLTVRT